MILFSLLCELLVAENHCFPLFLIDKANFINSSISFFLIMDRSIEFHRTNYQRAIDDLRRRYGQEYVDEFVRLSSE